MYMEAKLIDNCLKIPIKSKFNIVITAKDDKLTYSVSVNNMDNSSAIIAQCQTIIDSTINQHPDSSYEVIEALASYLETIQVIPLDPIPKFVDNSTIQYCTSKSSTFKKSVFIVHYMQVITQEDITQFTNKVKLDFPNASHHILSYILSSTDYGFNDDGESGAGHKVLFMMRMNNLLNCAVIVSRWFGGVKLGPIRFKLITNYAREFLIEQHILK